MTTFSQRHYIAVAKELRDALASVQWMHESKHAGAKDMHHIVVQYLTSIFVEDNPRFDMDKFINACWPE